MFEKVKEFLVSQLSIKAEDIKLESRIIEDLGADSLDVVELLMTLEDEMEVEVSDEQAVNLKTVNDIVNLISKK